MSRDCNCPFCKHVEDSLDSRIHSVLSDILWDRYKDKPDSELVPDKIDNTLFQNKEEIKDKLLGMLAERHVGTLTREELETACRENT